MLLIILPDQPHKVYLIYPKKRVPKLYQAPNALSIVFRFSNFRYCVKEWNPRRMMSDCHG